MTQQKILLVEDTKEVHQMVQQALVGVSVELMWADGITKAKELLNANSFDLILLDIELPDGSGLNLCSEILGKNPHMPIFFLTGKVDLSEKVLGFSAGADDYITKPFDLLELKARIEGKLKKIELVKENSSLLHWKEIQINKNSQEVSIFPTEEGEKIDLTALEFKILMFLAQRPNEVVERGLMLDEIWGKDVHVYSRSVDTHVSKLRRKLGDVSHIVDSVHGVGYKFIPTPL